MKIVLLCTGYSLDADTPSLSDEMAEALVRKGHEVSVFVVNWSKRPLGKPVSIRNEKLSVYVADPFQLNFGPQLLRKIAKWTLSSMSVVGQLLKFRRNNKADVVVGFSPATAMLVPIVLMTAFSRARTFLVQWDFFPNHHAQIGLLSGTMMVRVLKWLETWLMRRFEVIGCMSPKNITYLLGNYNLSSRQKIVELPIWSSFPPSGHVGRGLARQEFGLPADTTVLVFGGQLSKGRGIEDILEAASQAALQALPCVFLIVGNGEQEGMVRDAIGGGAHNVMHMAGLTRKKYLSLLSACDIGIVSTVRGVDVPTFPSKTLDYINIGLPVLASVEEATDFGEFVKDSGIGLSVPAGDAGAFVRAIEQMISAGPAAPWNNAQAFARARERFQVDGVSDYLLESVGQH
ncbi:Glycosyltransferase involved in cell wall bisynthesis [Cupriavidus sp. YR651]|uniref:glycosyltransferase family 4 protein n=1 Tax=Cupriavidus sp. YR651 TaxID=1855315 RepID=UPI00087FB1FB|nr:glycosyltransferase family 4 protein [Cupriavidus sp. YR651]SDC22095.1 Glycosyltransferase involved in cell wall bisynthesis [Cupriavidus sp. YR651]